MSGRTQFNIYGYRVDDDVALDSDLFNIAAGATLVLLGVDILSDDAIGGEGRVNLRGSTLIDDGLALFGAAQFVNMSQLTQNEPEVFLGLSSSDAVMARNASGATWTLNDGADFTGEGRSQFVNLGALDQLSGTAFFDVNFYDRGGAISTDGYMVFDSPGDVNRFMDDSIVGTGEFTLDGGVLVGSDISVASVVLTARMIGDVSISSTSVALDGVNLAAGAVLSLTNPDPTVRLDDEISGAGKIVIEGDAEVVSGVAYLQGVPSQDDSATLVGGVTLENSGQSTFSGPGITPSAFLLNTKPWSGDVVTIENDSGATWTGASQIQQTNNDGGSTYFINDGVVIDNGDGDLFDIPVLNNGVMQAGTEPQTGLSVSQAFYIADLSGAGTVDIGSDYVEVGGVKSGQTVNFDSALPAGTIPPSLYIDNPQSFAGLVTGFDQNGVADDQIVIVSATSSWQYQDFVENSGGTGGSLMFTDGSSEAAVNLAGNYDPNSFHADVSAPFTTITYNGR